MLIRVSSLQHLPRSLAGGDVDEVISVLPRKEMPHLPALSVPHTVVEVEDIGFGGLIAPEILAEILAEDPSCLIPSMEHVEAILAVGRRALLKTPEWTILLHCHAGLSRSVAGAYMLLALEDGPGQEAQSYDRLKAITNDPHPLPNFHLVQLADGALERQGRLLAQVKMLDLPPESIF